MVVGALSLLAVPVTYHATHLDGYDTSDKLAMLGSLAFFVLAAVLVATPAPPDSASA